MSNPNDYVVGWICAISTELVAARAFLDEEHDPPDAVSPHDNNIYTLGKMGKHNIVIAALPDGEYGVSAAASVARDMLHSFPNVRIGLMVGIGGGVPGKHDIRLGDVVVSTTQHEHGGIFQYDFGKTIQSQTFQNTMFLDQPPTLLRSAVGDLKARYESDGHQFQEAMKSILAKKPKLRKKYQRPDPRTDRLYLNNAVHPFSSNEGCEIACSDSMLVPRAQRAEDEDDPIIHYGLIASGNQLMKDALIRDQLASEKDVLCFEMEAAGLMNHFPCLVVRGICDYSDSHKNDIWQGYAAMTAAAYAKDLIGRIPPTKIEAENRIADILSGVKQSVDRLVHVYHDQKNIDILDWLAPLDYSTQQSDHLRRRQAGTGEWLLNSDQFQAWIQNKDHILFCPGIPGAGKTVLTSVVVDHLHSRFQEDSKTGIAHFFFDYKQQDEQTTDAIVASFLRQLAACQSSLPEAVHELYRQHNTQANKTRPSTEELIRVLKSVAVIYSRIFIMIDAIDECKSTNGTRLEVLSCIFKLRSETRANFLITSRFNTEISSAFSGIPTLEIRANDEDVRGYLSGNMIHLPKFVRDDPSLQKEVIDSILQAVQGMFLLAQFHLDSLKGKTKPKEIKTALQNLATGSDAYEQIYTKTMERILGQYKEQTQLARSVLSWLTFAKGPMRVPELRHALGVEHKETAFDERNMPDIELMVSVCAGLVTIDNDSNIIRLVHYTTQEYFQRTRENWFPESQSEITRSCITYLSYEVFELRAGDDSNVIRTRANSYPDSNDIRTYANSYPRSRWSFEMDKLLGDALVELYPFYKYASRYWGEHARENPVLRDEVMEVLKNTAWIKTYCDTLKRIQSRGGELYSYFSDLVEQTTGLHLAAWFGLTAVVDELLNSNTYIEATNEYGETALQTAVDRGHTDIIQLLLDNNADIESVTKAGNTPLLHVAAASDSKAIVQLLLDNDANIEAADKRGRRPLHIAAEEGKQHFVLLLLEKCVDINAADNDGYTPLHLAVAKEHKEIATLLISRGAEVDAIDKYGRTPLWMVIANGLHFDYLMEYECAESFIQLLLNNGADIDAVDEYGYTPLLYAAEWYDKEIVAVLLSKGAEVNATNKSGETPLTKALTREDPLPSAPIIQLLLNNDADVDAVGHDGSTPLHSAVDFGLPEAVAGLLNKGAKVNAIDKSGKTPLFIAVEGRLSEFWDDMEPIFQLLLNNSTEIDATDNNGKTPLHYAVERNHRSTEHVVQFLLSNGANIHAVDESGNTPLHEAVKSQNLNRSVVEILLSKGANVNAANNNGKTPLFEAVERVLGPVKDLVQLLLNQGANIQVTYENGNTILHQAAKSSTREVVELLLSKGANVNAVNNYRETPLFYVFEGRWGPVEHLAQLHIFLNYGADIRTADIIGNTILHQAVKSSNIEVVELLLSKGANVNAADYNGKTPLFHLIESTNRWYDSRDMERFVQLLLDYGADIQTTDKDGNTILHKAVQYNNKPLATLLLNKGVKVNTVNKNSRTPLIQLIKSTTFQRLHNRDMESFVQLLLDYGADIQTTDEDGNTVLHQAVQNSNQPLATILLKNGAKVNVVNKNSKTPLFLLVERTTDLWSINRDLPSFIQLLLDNGADVQATDERGRTVLDVSERLDIMTRCLLYHSGTFRTPDVKIEALEDRARKRVRLNSLGERGAVAEVVSPLADFDFDKLLDTDASSSDFDLWNPLWIPK